LVVIVVNPGVTGLAILLGFPGLPVVGFKLETAAPPLPTVIINDAPVVNNVLPVNTPPPPPPPPPYGLPPPAPPPATTRYCTV
jgi:hypothetical protein